MPAEPPEARDERIEEATAIASQRRPRASANKGTRIEMLLASAVLELHRIARALEERNAADAAASGAGQSPR